MPQLYIAGATGLIGNTMSQLVTNSAHFQTTLLSRRPLIQPDSPHSVLVIEYSAPDLPPATSPADCIICALGTTIKKAGSQAAFRSVDFDMVLNLAHAANASGYKHFSVVSSIGADARSRNFYLRTKGEMEEALREVGFESLTIIRPSLLLGKRVDSRLAEDIGQILFSNLSFMFIGPLKKYRAVRAVSVAQKLLDNAKQSLSGVEIIESDEIKILKNSVE